MEEKYSHCYQTYLRGRSTNATNFAAVPSGDHTPQHWHSTARSAGRNRRIYKYRASFSNRPRAP